MADPTDTTDYDKLSKQDLIRLIKTKDVELAHLRKSLDKQAFDPSIFLNSKIRDLFWDKIKSAEVFSSEKYDKISKFQAEIQRNLHTIGERDNKIKMLEDELLDISLLKEENSKMKGKIQELEQDLKIRTRKEEEQHSKNHHLSRVNEILQVKVDEYERRIDDVEKHYIVEKEEYERERKNLSKRIQQMTVKRSTKKTLVKITSEFRASEVFYSGNNQINIEQIIMRFSSVPSESVKYSELLNLVKEFHCLVQEELEEINNKGVVNKEDKIEKEKVESLLNILTSDKMCNNYIKGLLSKDLNVFKNTIEFLIALGSDFLKAKHQLFEEDSIVSRLCEDLRNYTSFENKKTVLNLITELISASEKFTSSFVALGGVQILISEFLSYKDQVFINSQYFSHLLIILKKMMPNEHEFADFVNIEVLSYFVRLLSECYNKNSLFEVLQILNYLASKPNIRNRLLHLKIFRRVIKFYEDSWKTKDFKLLFYVFLLMGKFTREEGFKTQLIAHFEIQNDVSTLFEPFKEENSHLTTEEIKCATLEIIRNLIMQNSPQKMREVLVKSSFLKSAIQVCMADDSKMLKSLALDCLISVKDFVLKNIMKLDDIIINLEKLYDTKDSSIQSKTLLFVSWGLKSQCLEKSIIKQEFIIRVSAGSLLSLEVGEASKFRKEFLALYLMLEDEAWRETILSVKYFENLLTARIAKNKGTIKAWLNSIALVLECPYLTPIFKSNPNYIKFVWIEISENIKEYTIEVLLVIRACIGLESFREKFQNLVFISLVVSSFVNVEKAIKNENIIFVCYEVLHYFVSGSIGRDIILKNKALLECMKRRLKEGEEVSKVVIRIFHALIVNYEKKDIELMCDRELIMGLNFLTTKMAEYDIAGFCIDVAKNLISKNVIPESELRIEPQYMQTEVIKTDLGTRFKPKLTLCEDIIEQMMDSFKKDYIDSLND